MKIMRSKGKVVLVATGPTDPNGRCPRLIVNEKTSRIRDDYHGRVKISKKLLDKIV